MRLDRSLLSGLPIFKNIDGRDIDFILSNATSLRVAKDAEVFRQGADADRFFLLLSGHIRVVRITPDGEQTIARYINAGELCGIAMALGLPTYPATAIAAVDCVVLAWPDRMWPELQARVPQFGISTYQAVGTRLQETQARVVEMSTQQVQQRIASALLRLVQQAGRKTEDGIRIDFPITRQDIAQMTGTTLHTVSRVLSAWEQKGIVRSTRQRISVSDPHGLLLLSENRFSE